MTKFYSEVNDKKKVIQKFSWTLIYFKKPVINFREDLVEHIVG